MKHADAGSGTYMIPVRMSRKLIEEGGNENVLQKMWKYRAG